MAFTLRLYNFFSDLSFHIMDVLGTCRLLSVAHGCILSLLLRFSRADPARLSRPKESGTGLSSQPVAGVGDAWAISEAWVSLSSVAQSCPTLRPHALQHARLPCPSPTP